MWSATWQWNIHVPTRRGACPPPRWWRETGPPCPPASRAGARWPFLLLSLNSSSALFTFARSEVKEFYVRSDSRRRRTSCGGRGISDPRHPRGTIASATPPRIAAAATANRGVTVSPNSTTAALAAITGTRSWTTAAVAGFSDGNAAYQRLYPTPEARAPEIKASVAPRAVTWALIAKGTKRASAKGRLRRKLSAVVGSGGAPERRPRSE